LTIVLATDSNFSMPVKTASKTKAKTKRKLSELGEPIWAAVSSTGCAAINITYQEAEQTVAQDESLTIVTAEAAKRICQIPHPAK
jgi:hypothetical protein